MREISNINSNGGIVNATNGEAVDKCTFPMPDAKYVRAAEAFFSYAPDECKPRLAYKIILKAQEFGIVIKNPIIYIWAEKVLK